MANPTHVEERGAVEVLTPPSASRFGTQIPLCHVCAAFPWQEREFLSEVALPPYGTSMVVSDLCPTGEQQGSDTEEPRASPKVPSISQKDETSLSQRKCG